MAHFRRVWFKPTETFLHTLVRSFQRSPTLLIGLERAGAEAFPVDCPVLALRPPGSLAARWSHRRARLLRRDSAPGFDARRALREIERRGVRVLHAHFGYTGYEVLPVQRRTGLPLVTSFYGEDASRLPRQAEWRARFDELFARGDLFLAEGPRMAQRLMALGCPREKLVVHPIAIEPGRYPFRQRAPRPPGEPVRLLFCASFREKKGLRYALEAVARVRHEVALELRVGGDGPEWEAVHTLAASLELGESVRFLGFLPHARLIEEMHAADLFVQPSVTAENGDTEGGAPTTLLEAQACGLPVLATRHADIPHVVEEDESALLSPERDVDGLAANLRLLAKEPERWAAMGVAGRTHVERFHDAATGAARLEDLYRALAGDGA